jgi:group I intron endonuclease
MRSGIYLLTFKNGDKYVGRSVDIERRWAEHADKLRKGTAAKALQYAYNNYGFPKASVLTECHADHADLLETYYICKLQPELNTIGGLALSNDDLKVLEASSEVLKLSTADHIRMLAKFNEDLEYQERKYKELSELLDERRLKLDVENKIEELDTAHTELYKLNGDLEDLVEELEKEVEMWKQRANEPWWKRMFKWW